MHLEPVTEIGTEVRITGIWICQINPIKLKLTLPVPRLFRMPLICTLLASDVKSIPAIESSRWRLPSRMGDRAVQ